MAKNQTTAKEKATESSSVRAPKPRAPRVTASQHSKVVSSEPVESPVMQQSSGNAHQVISEIAYSYWESRGYQHGAHLEDWVRAEHEYGKRLAATVL